MKRRLSAIVLALGLSLSVFSMGVFAAETETEAATEQATEQATEPSSEAATEAASDAEDALEEMEAATEVSEQTETVSPEEQYKMILTTYLTQVSSWTDDQIEMLIDGDDPTGAAIASNWKSVKEELGAFVEVTDAQLSEDGTEISGHAKYEKASDKTEVVASYKINEETQTATMNWDINYSFGVLMQRAAMNTVMGIGIVFVTLLFLSALISQMHLIPDMVDKMSKKKAPAPAPAAASAPAAAPAPAVEEEEYVDDLELVAVITAAIAASENTSSDGFVVRSIKKANKRNWQRA